MPSRSSGASRRRSTRARRKLVWARQTNIDIVQVLQGENAAPAHTDLLAPFETQYGAQLIGCTVVRIRGIMGIASVAAPLTFIRAAIRIADENDVERAPNDNDSPFSENAAYLDWMAWEPFLVPRDANEAASEVSRRVVDIRSSRKLEELNQSLLLSVGGSTADASPVAVSFFSNLSILVALP